MKQNMQDLTEGSLGKKILIFSVPLMLSNLLQVLFNMADIAVIGQFAGSLSLGAVGSTATLVTMLTGFLIGLSGVFRPAPKLPHLHFLQQVLRSGPLLQRLPDPGGQWQGAGDLQSAYVRLRQQR